LDGIPLEESLIRYFEYAQRVAEEQLKSLAEEAGRSGVSLYCDLPLGAGRHSYDVWRHRDLFAMGASTGAPPDAYFVQGQDWGFPPWHPDGIRAEGYAHFIAVLRRVLSVAGVLRIDHVMGLHRLFWVPEGMPPADGVYVHYHPEEMYAILCLESHKHGATIVGEDLGIVPREVESSLARHNIVGMHVLQYAVSGDPPGVRQAPARAAASLNTHDTPPFAAWLEGGDIDDAVRLGFIDRPAAEEAHAGRRRQREALREFLGEQGLAPGGRSSKAGLLRGALRHLARSRARMVIVNLEDLWLEKGRQNIPGTNDEMHPNWRRKAARSIEEIEENAGIAASLREVSVGRTEGRHR
jgi:4-alpha-glucanotransferase